MTEYQRKISPKTPTPPNCHESGNQTLTAQANRARAVIAGEKRPKGTRFVTVHAGDATLDKASIARARSLVGLKGYVTNIPARLMDAGEVVASYHELWHARAVLFG